MQILLITIATLVLTFLLNPVFKNVSKRTSFKLHVHHSVLGVLLFVVGLAVGNNTITAVGLGIYLGHVMEEIYFNKKGVIEAFFIFVTH